MKLTLRTGVPLLLALLLLSQLVDFGPAYTLLLVAAMGIALWMAFSLPHPSTFRDRDAMAEDGEAEPEMDLLEADDDDIEQGRHDEKPRSTPFPNLKP